MHCYIFPLQMIQGNHQKSVYLLSAYISPLHVKATYLDTSCCEKHMQSLESGASFLRFATVLILSMNSYLVTCSVCANETFRAAGLVCEAIQASYCQHAALQGCMRVRRSLLRGKYTGESDGAARFFAGNKPVLRSVTCARNHFPPSGYP